MLIKRTIFICLLACATALLVLGACQRGGETGGTNANGNLAPGSPPAASNQSGQSVAVDPAKLDAEISRLEPEAERDPDDDATRGTLAHLYFQRGSLRQQGGQLNEALRDYQNALRYDPAHEEANIRVAQITREMEPEPRAEDGKPVAVPAASPGGTKEQ
ncbi:MAG: hypothetical protein ACRD9R_02915 [Pyrinomonadaceae bacterium]